jgi:hypothetical protein
MFLFGIRICVQKEAEILVKRMESSSPGYLSMFFSSRQYEFKCFFSQENDLVFCSDI